MSPPPPFTAPSAAAPPPLLPRRVPGPDALPLPWRTLDELDLYVDTHFAQVGADWIELARAVVRSPLAARAAAIADVQRLRAAMDEAVAAVAAASAADRAAAVVVRDRAVDVLVHALDDATMLSQSQSQSQLDGWRTAIASQTPVAFRRRPAAVVDPMLWRELLADYDRLAQAGARHVRFDDRLHAAAVASLAAFLAGPPGLRGATDAMRVELQQLRDDQAAFRLLQGRIDAAAKAAAAALQAHRRAETYLHKADDAGRTAVTLMSSAAAAGGALLAAWHAVRDLEAEACALARAGYPELREAAELPVHALSAYDDVRPLDAPGSACLLRTAVGGAGPVVLKEYALGKRDVAAFLGQLSVLRRIAEADCFVSVLAAFREDEHAYLELPLYKHRSLFAWVREARPTPDVRRSAVHRLAVALERVHLAGVVHGDVRPDNVFAMADGLPVLGDYYIGSSRSTRPAAYAAPELPKGATSAAGDVYSLGLLFLDVFGDGEKPAAVSALDSALRPLVQSMLHADPGQRPRASAVVHGTARGVARAAEPLVAVPLFWSTSRLDRVVPARFDVTAEMLGMLQRLVDRSILPDSLGHGRDVCSGEKPYSRLEIVAVARVEAPALFRRFQRGCEELVADLRDAPTPVPVEVETDGWFAGDSKYAPLAAAGEKWLFASSSWPGVARQLREGIDVRGAGALFGAGAYFAENADKADQYAHSEQGGDLFPLLLCRVALGASSAVAEPLEARPCTELQCTSRFRCAHRRADSLVALCQRRDGVGAVRRHREYVVFDSALAYPQFLITYRRRR